MTPRLFAALRALTVRFPNAPEIGDVNLALGEAQAEPEPITAGKLFALAETHLMAEQALSRASNAKKATERQDASLDALTRRVSELERVIGDIRDAMRMP